MSETMQAYCMKCRTKRDIQAPQAIFTASGTPATSGVCAVCGTKLFRMGETAAHAGMERPEAQPRKRSAEKSKAKGGKKKTSASSRGAASKGKRKSSTRKTSGRSTDASTRKTRSSAGPKVGKLVVVESPAKARSVGGFLGRDYTVIASKGHVRDLLVSQLSVDVENGFEPKYRVPNDKRDVVNQIREAAQHATEIYLATDPDREGEAIAWHLVNAAGMPKKNLKRVVFHEITNPAIREAFEKPREIDMDLVNAQQARRILDRLVGYNVTQLLWEKVRNRLSAGRVQSSALRLVVDREREIEAFQSQEYWTIDVELSKETVNGKAPEKLVAHLVRYYGKDIALHSEADARPHVETLERSTYVVSDVKTGQRKRKPSAPFTTSTLQQEASRRLGYTAKRTMGAAQQLYEGIEVERGNVVGLITYMRTDSLNVSSQAQAEARHYIAETFGKAYVPHNPPKYKTKAKGAQEAHEAIRPTSVERTPASLKGMLTSDQFRLYKLIWERFVASQMESAVYDTVRVEIAAGPSAKERPYLLRSAGSRVRFQGFLALYEDARDEDAQVDEDEGRILPELVVDEALNRVKVDPEQHFTQPPPRYTEASLVRILEEYGIGRPSTYAPTVAVIQDRDYVGKEDKRLVPTETGKIVSDLLAQYFPEEMDYQFTARMEEHLDEISEGHEDWRPVLSAFYDPFEKRLMRARTEIPRVRQEEEVGRACPLCGNPLVIKYGRWGKFIGCSTYPECRHTEPLLEYIGVPCPACGKEHGGQLVERRSRKGRVFYSCSRYPKCDYSTWNKPGQAAQSSEEAVSDLRESAG